ncbi:hypothetical protein I6F37_38275, partial [Bradyrhizobium sp. NBAIM08]|nr:hypothetical protein [Bradyrhizobium sp. NBAIM08]
MPNSSGTEPPRLKAPAHAADCHIHIYDPRFAPPVAKPANATVADYQRLQKRLGVTRVVIVTPRNYVTDNSVTLDAIRQLGADDARGVEAHAVMRERLRHARLYLQSLCLPVGAGHPAERRRRREHEDGRASLRRQPRIGRRGDAHI